MITILHDIVTSDTENYEWAKAGCHEVICDAAATCVMATRLIELGTDPRTRVRLVRADPIIGGPPYEVSGMSLYLASKLNLLGQIDGMPAISSGAGRQS